MPRTTSPVTVIQKMLGQLQAERNKLQSKLDEIDATFAELGIQPGRKVSRGPGRPRKAAAGAAKKKTTKKKGGRRKKRGVFKQSGEVAVLEFIKSKGKPTSAEINAFWASQGRGGRADNTLTKLTQAKKIKRFPIKGERGSRYSAT